MTADDSATTFDYHTTNGEDGTSSTRRQLAAADVVAVAADGATGDDSTMGSTNASRTVDHPRREDLRHSRSTFDQRNTVNSAATAASFPQNVINGLNTGRMIVQEETTYLEGDMRIFQRITQTLVIRRHFRETQGGTYVSHTSDLTSTGGSNDCECLVMILNDFE